MDRQLLFFLILFTAFFAEDAWLTRRFKQRFAKDDNYLGKRAPDAVQLFFGRMVYAVFVYYGMALIDMLTGFDFWGLVSAIRLLDHPVVTTLGFALSLGALALMALARLSLGRSWRVGLDHASEDRLVTTGFYRHVRNPYFTFFLCFQAALVLTVPTSVTLFAWVQSTILLTFQVLQEEIFLEGKYGPSYTAYKARTGRFLPRFGR